MEFEYAEPEKYGIPSRAVQRFEERLKRLGVRMHGYLLLCGNHIVGETYRAPYGPDTRHRMYSVTKSFTSMAVGLLLKQGKIALNDPVCGYFPEKLPEEGPHPWCAEMTIRDMLTMRTCYASTTYKRYEGGDWVESFFRVKPDHVPGTVFSYDTSSSHVLAALAEKLTGMGMLDYLRREALDKMGFSKNAYILKDPAGVSLGGSGLMCTLRDVAKAAYLCNHYGILEGEELLPADFMRQAAACQVPTDLQPALDEQGGYGYMFWMPREPSACFGGDDRAGAREHGRDCMTAGQAYDGFTMYGMGGQLALCFPKLDFCLVTMADTIGSSAGLQVMYDSFYDILFPALCAGHGGEMDLYGYGGETEECGRTGCGAELPSGKYVFSENPMGWKWLEFDWGAGSIRFENPDGVQELAFGLEEWRRQTFPNTSYQCECRGVWKMKHFLLHCFVTDEEQGHVSMDFAWKDRRLSVRMVSVGEPFQQYFKGTGSAAKDTGGKR